MISGQEQAPRRLEELLLAALLVGIALHGLQILALGVFGLLPLCWIGGTLILAALAAFKISLWRKSAPGVWRELCSGWLAPWPWIFGILLAVQIVVYPPTMSDSLCYRLPRLFLALQEGGIARFPTPDARMNAMPWGWEMLALPFASLNALNASKFINLACWALVYQTLFSLLRQRDTPHARARWVALAFSSAPAFLLQASSTANDLYAATLILIGVWMIHRFAASPGPVPVLASLLALILAANAKPQFFVLGLPWLVWWAIAPGKPWKQVPWGILALAAPFYFLVSPLPLLVGNYQLAGNLLGAETGTALATKPAALPMIAAGGIQFLAAQLQVPLLPGSERLTSIAGDLPGIRALSGLVPDFKPEWKPLFIVDWASLGLVHLLVLIVGLALGSRGKSAWPWIATFCFGCIFSASQVVPTTIGRSFFGFFSLLLPLAAWGLARSNHRYLPPLLCMASLATGLTAMVLNPSAPLWPSRALESFAKNRGMGPLEAKLETYHSYQERARTGTGLLDRVPHGEPVGILLRQVTPVSTLWQPDWRAHRIQYVNHLDPDAFAKGPVRWLVVAGNAAEFFPEQSARFSNLPGWAVEDRKTYLPNLSQGPETWTLYRNTTP